MRVTHGLPLARQTTLGIGGPAAVFADLQDLADFPEFVSLADSFPGAPTCLGAGSNALVADAGCSSPVLRMNTKGVRFVGEAVDGRTLVEVQAGHPLSDLVDTALGHGLIGLEMLAGIPGTVGATPVQNVGAYGQEISDTLVEVTAWDWLTRRRVTLDAAACRLGHRTSVFKGSSRWTLLTVVFALRKSVLSAPISYRMVAERLDIPVGSQVPPAEASQAVLAVRRGKGMVLGFSDVDRRTVGSVFFSPELTPAQVRQLEDEGAAVNRFPDGSTRVSASWLIRRAGFALGSPVAKGVRVSYLHHTLIADVGASAAGFTEAIDVVVQRVLERTGIRLTPEIDFLGDWHEGHYSTVVESTISGPTGR
ncbi:UDP-N-acetylmuramate dehydrogenase [Streptomyces noursei]|uniref:UDP-N-acetylmuramate dehydrogenase n=1 Tax=Streptomyces noursei TaxID=1971 RepID=UPI00167C3958|nr:UDP-N-acetylmuramate dehydrogenase [Streptomyces noursei]MCZ1017005.1 UDP-N-acetylmuramate dehydrogenase [Streptomyces noursei]GGX05353.1 UDP-N-acetylenolpyruvoylglucosamine reductase [Streptomyces noursei]